MCSTRQHYIRCLQQVVPKTAQVLPRRTGTMWYEQQSSFYKFLEVEEYIHTHTYVRLALRKQADVCGGGLLEKWLSVLLSLPVVREDTASSKAPASHLACPSMKCALTKEGSSSRARPQSATTSVHCFSLQWHRALLLYSTAWDGLAACHVRRSSHHTRGTMFLLNLYTMFVSLASQGRAERMPIARLNIDRILTIACEYTSSAASTLPWEYNLFPCSFNCLAAILL